MSKPVYEEQSLPVCRKTPVRYQFMSIGMVPHVKLIIAVILITIIPLGAIIMTHEPEYLGARVTYNNQQDDGLLLLLLDSKGQPHIFWANWRTSWTYKLFHATLSSRGVKWKIDTCPTSLSDWVSFLTGTVDEEDNFHLIYSYVQDVGEDIGGIPYYVICFNNNSWSTPKIVEPADKFILDLHIEVDSESGEKRLFYAELVHDKLPQKKVFIEQAIMDSSNQWQLSSQLELPDSFMERKDLIGIKRVADDTIRVQYLQRTYYGSYNYSAPEALVCSYHHVDTLENINTDIFPLPSIEEEKWQCCATEFPTNDIGLITLEPNNLPSSMKDEVGNTHHWDGFQNLTIYFANTSSNLERIIITDAVLLDQFGLDKSSFVQVTDNEFVFVMQQYMFEEILDDIAGDTNHAGQGLYFVCLIKEGTSLIVSSHGWLHKDSYTDNEGPYLAVDSKNRLHLAWIRTKGDSRNSEIYYDHEGSGFGLIDWSKL